MLFRLFHLFHFSVEHGDVVKLFYRYRFMEIDVI
jgi:hypothetical protein